MIEEVYKQYVMDTGDADTCRFLTLTLFEIETLMKRRKKQAKDKYLFIEELTSMLTERISFVLGSNIKPTHVFDMFEDLFQEEREARSKVIEKQREARRKARKVDREIQEKINKKSHESEVI